MIGLKGVYTACLTGAICFAAGLISGAIAAGSGVGYILLLAAAGVLLVYVASRTAIEDAHWTEEQAVKLTVTDDGRITSDEYERGYDDGYNNAQETLQFTAPPPRPRKGKRKRKPQTNRLGA